MLIITADDFGKNQRASDSILMCFLLKRITAASAMVFMEDSERAAAAASAAGIEVGLHVNFTLPFTAPHTPKRLCDHQARLVSYLTKHRLSQIFYNPFLTDSFRFVFWSQKEEFIRLYSKLPGFYNGHHHMHLCANMMADNILPKRAKVRRTFTFEKGDKGIMNRVYRQILHLYFSRRFFSTSSFFSIEPIQNQERLKTIIARASREYVEIETHPENEKEARYLLSDQFKAVIEAVRRGAFSDLPIMSSGKLI